MIATITYSRHADKRMRERGVSRTDIEATLRAPDMTLPADNGNLWAVRTAPGGPTTTVVYAVTGHGMFGDAVHVVSVW